MKIDLEKLKEVEGKYRNDTITFNALQDMVSAILNQRDANLFGLEFGPNIALATATLTELGIIDWEGAVRPEKKKKVEQLNS